MQEKGWRGEGAELLEGDAGGVVVGVFAQWASSFVYKIENNSF